ncbi:acid-sensing ion channel 1-like [Ostrea edulis]|uniref:acid-sensing ion channel 1-like n=1 Tax=Ostrea edulis TaxID=37623 RepID=UPI0024AF94DF|nr:acid-sensing ion channel 1-like [Ostrea edulis]
MYNNRDRNGQRKNYSDSRDYTGSPFPDPHEFGFPSSGYQNFPSSNTRPSSEIFYRPYRVETPVDYRRSESRRIDDQPGRSDDRDGDHNQESTKPRKSLSKIITRFADKTAMQGVGYITSAKFWYSKAIWVFLLVIVALTDPSRFNPGGSSGIVYAIVLPRKKRFVEDFGNIDFDNFTYYDDYYSDPNYSDDDFRDAPRDDVYEMESTFRNLYLAMPRDVRVQTGHQIQDMLLSCSFNGYKCFADNFTLVNTPEYGNCFSIQSEGFVTKNAGPKSGLTMMLYTENDEYLPGISQGYGMRLQIHKQGTFPIPDQEGIFISSSYETHIGLRLKDITRVTPPHRDCDDGVELKRQHRMEYSRTVCRIICEQSAMLQDCGCYAHEYKEFYYFSNSTFQNQWCKTQNDIKCISRVRRDYKLQKRFCSCLNPCREKKYSLFPSSRQWPTTEYANTLLQGLCEHFPLKCLLLTSITDPRLLSLNFLKVTIYFEDLNYEHLEEEPEITTAQFASDVGGAIGLWIGLSILAIFEVVQFFIELCAYGVYLCGNTEKKNHVNQTRNDRKPTGNLKNNQEQYWSY